MSPQGAKAPQNVSRHFCPFLVTSKPSEYSGHQVNSVTFPSHVLCSKHSVTAEPEGFIAFNVEAVVKRKAGG